MKIWITGIAGFLGSHLADALLAAGHEVEGNDSLICGSRKNVPKRVPFCYTDCRNFEPLKYFMSEFKPDVVVHCAAIASEGFSVFSPNFVTSNIAEASVSTFSAAIASGAKRIVHMSSMARYGGGIVPFTEDTPLNPVDCYGIAKVYSEQQLKVLCETHGVRWSILNPHNVIGARQQITPYRNVCTIFLNRLKLDLPIYIYGDGLQKRCFSPIADVIPSIVRAVHGDADSEIVNIGPDNGEITINALLRMCEDVVGKKSDVIYLPARPVTDTVKEAYCSSDKSRKLLGYEPKQSMIDCIKEMSDALEPAPFNYNFPVEIESPLMPRTWSEKL
jgi:UDP-glucose 4-epimerase